jgi:hypothetical protein
MNIHIRIEAKDQISWNQDEAKGNRQEKEDFDLSALFHTIHFRRLFLLIAKEILISIPAWQHLSSLTPFSLQGLCQTFGHNFLFY